MKARCVVVVIPLFVCFVRSDGAGLFVIGGGDHFGQRSLDGLQRTRGREDFRFEVTHSSSPFVWNFRAKENGAPNEIIPLTGSFIPFPPTKAERLKNGDPRLSIAERYPSRAVYLAKVKAAAQRLVKERYLLAQDVDPIVSHAGTVWDGLAAKSQPAGGG